MLNDVDVLPNAVDGFLSHQSNSQAFARKRRLGSSLRLRFFAKPMGLMDCLAVEDFPFCVSVGLRLAVPIKGRTMERSLWVF